MKKKDPKIEMIWDLLLLEERRGFFTNVVLNCSMQLEVQLLRYCIG